MDGSIWVIVALAQRVIWDIGAVIIVWLSILVWVSLRDQRIALEARADFIMGGPRDDALDIVFGLFYLAMIGAGVVVLLGLFGTTAPVPAPDSLALWRSLIFGGIMLGGEGLMLVWLLRRVFRKLQRFQ